MNNLIVEICRTLENIHSVGTGEYITLEINPISGFDGDYSRANIDYWFNRRFGEKIIEQLDPIYTTSDLESSLENLIKTIKEKEKQEIKDRLLYLEKEAAKLKALLGE
jgi:hypothetical protein